ncbi:MAG: hypothetical protein ACFFG0_06950 [Candidatus Thorarchaeota archaeon]
MVEPIELKKLEKKAYKSTFQDGIWDIFMGMILLNLGLGSLFIWIFNLPEILNTIIFSLGLKYDGIPNILFREKEYHSPARWVFLNLDQSVKQKQENLRSFCFQYSLLT